MTTLWWRNGLTAVALCMAMFLSRAHADDSIDFNSQIRPILAANCFKCHGPDESAREADLRLDISKDAVIDRGGYRAIAPGSAANSEVIKRITNQDIHEQMPPPDTGLSLTAGEIKLLSRWIDEGAKYRQHWAFVPPKSPVVPGNHKHQAWPRNEIDHFVLARMEAHGLEPSAVVDRYALVRRVFLDLIGLPPTPAQADAFVNDTDPQAYEKLVDRLLKSPQYGERWARPWLDLARYSDTNGYEKDRPRSIWPYRDWVIAALNDDMPYDQFTIEQLAGDMLPNATPAQRVATGFHRNTMLNEEGGIDPLEYRFHAVVDRVATTGTVWLGLTVGCAQCHTHKYDPITHTDYYQIFALLNNADEPDMSVPVKETLDRRAQLLAEIQDLKSARAAKFPPVEGKEPLAVRRQTALQAKFAEWKDLVAETANDWQVLKPLEMQAGLTRLEVQADGSVFAGGDATKRDVYQLKFAWPAGMDSVTALRLEALPDERLPANGPGRAYYEGRQGDFFLSELTARADENIVPLKDASHSFGKISIGSGNANATNVIDNEGSTGWSTATREGQPHQLVVNFNEPVAAAKALEVTLVFERHFAASLGRFRIAATSATGDVKAGPLPVDVERVLGQPTRNNAEEQLLLDHFLSIAPELAKANAAIQKLQARLPALPQTLIMQERPTDHPRPTHRHHRGEYLQPREAVAPGLPEFLGSLPKGTRPTRLALARWLVSKDNPLAARVAVNRAWRSFFGSGLVQTSGDFGVQSSPPTHPLLLDWLATDFVDQGWSMKRLHRQIVLSATYRQSSNTTPAKRQRDPSNVWLARGPRVRLEAEVVRDVMLQAGGKLSHKLGGPGVFPPQPAEVTRIAYGGFKWTPSKGEDRYRRSLYTFSKRTAPFAAYRVLDAPSGERCEPRRQRSNTPLAALTLLNDEMFVELAQALATTAYQQNSISDEDRVVWMFRRYLTRSPGKEEIATLLAFYEQVLNRFETGELKPATVTRQADATPELAALVLLSRAMMNLDEVITKQ